MVLHFSMLTQNCDGHPLLSLMHKPDPTKSSLAQDKRAVVPIERAQWDEWLRGTVQQAEALIQVPDAEVFRHGSADPAKQVLLV